MKRSITGLFFLVLLLSLSGRSFARRGNPAPNGNAGNQFYVVDSDDDDPRTPTYKFVDTTYGTWHRLTGFSSTDDAILLVPTPTDSLVSTFFTIAQRTVPPAYITTNGVMTLDTFVVNAAGTAQNVAMKTNGNGFTSLIAPLWGDMEFRTTGDSTKVFYRATIDSGFITYYNLFLKGTNGQVRATFQVAFCKADSSVQFNYKSFDGNFVGLPASMLFEKTCTIGLQNHQGVYGTTYLDRGVYYAKSLTSQIYAKDLHNQLAVKFIRVIPNFIRLTAINWPPADRYEMTNNQFQPVVTFENTTSQTRKVYVVNSVTNLGTGVRVYNRTDSVDVGFNDSYQFTASLSSMTCGRYRLTTTISVPSLGTDGWTPDNVMTRDFVYMSSTSAPYYDDYVTLDPCFWHLDGATWTSAANNAMIDQPGPITSGSVVLNRRDINDVRYVNDNSSDTITSTSINLGSSSNVWLAFSYQRGSSADSTEAGVITRTLVGPEPVLLDTLGNLARCDTLYIEALKSTGTKWNDVDADWATIGSIIGGLDVSTHIFRMQVPSTYLHDHSRFRLRLASRNSVGLFASPPFDDDDNWVIDGFELNAATNGQTELMPFDLDLGNGLFTHIPRNVLNIVPKVKIGNNGLVTNLGAYNVRLIITDAFSRKVYHQVQTLYTPPSHGDTTISFPAWEIEGSQGGLFSAKLQLEQNFNEIRRQNDTITLLRTMYIDNSYAYDDGVPDTSGAMVVADPHFFLDFQPMNSDSLRGVDFYHVDATGTTNWSVTIRGSGNQTVASRSFSYNVLTRGWIHPTFNPIYLDRDSTYRIEFNMTQGFGLGGDGSRGLIWKIKNASSTAGAQYNGLYPTLLAKYRDQNLNPYLTVGGNGRNAAAGGPILPMARLIFKGSSTFLPVELASFNARRSADGEVMLAFATAKEQEVDHFEIDRQNVNGWQTLTSLAAENSELGSSYAAVDATAPFTAVTYRLSEVDLDGSHKIAGYTTAAPFGSSEPLGVSVSPNPAGSRIHVQLSGITDAAKITLYDLLGKVVLSASSASNGELDLDAAMLPSGTYSLEVTSDGQIRRTSVVIQK